MEAKIVIFKGDIALKGFKMFRVSDYIAHQREKDGEIQTLVDHRI